MKSVQQGIAARRRCSPQLNAVVGLTLSQRCPQRRSGVAKNVRGARWSCAIGWKLGAKKHHIAILNSSQFGFNPSMYDYAALTRRFQNNSITRLECRDWSLVHGHVSILEVYPTPNLNVYANAVVGLSAEVVSRWAKAVGRPTANIPFRSPKLVLPFVQLTAV